MKAIMISIQPQYVADILNGKKTLEIRKTIPKCKLPIDVYIYVTKGKSIHKDLVDYRGKAIYNRFVLMPKGRKATTDDSQPRLNGKVVAKFILDKVEEVCCEQLSNGVGYDTFYYTETIETNDELEKASCLDLSDLKQYLGVKSDGRIVGYAWHIDRLGIFDNPMELWQFKTPKNAERYKQDLQQAREDDYEVGTRLAEGVANDDECANCVELTEMSEGYYGLTRAPQSWCYVEV